ncbi:MAG: HAMP domain-containing protein [Elusimicrobia bacterium]|nr:HAMP domain-containing protein [Elusimicrobiota bacterium]
MGRPKFGLSRRFAAVMGALALGPVLFLSWRMMQSSRRGVQDAVLELHVKLAEDTAARVQGWIDGVDGRVRVAMTALRSRMEWPDKQALLKSLVESDAGIASITLLRRQGGAILEVFNPALAGASTRLDPAQERAALARALSSGERTAEIVRGKTGPMLVLHYPFNSEVFARVVVPLSDLAQRIAGERVGGTGFAVLIDAQGRALAAPEGEDLSGLESWPITKAALQSSRTVGSSEFTSASGRAYVGAYAPVPSFGGAVLILQSRREAYLASADARRAAATAIFVVILGSLLAAGLLARALTAPVLRLTSAAEAVARGDFDVHVDVTTGDELQDLAETFNAMTERLRQYSVLQVDRLIAEQRKTAAILFSIGEGIVMADREGRVQLINRRAREMFGLKEGGDLEGRALTEALPEGPLRDAMIEAGARKPGEFKEVDLSSVSERRFVRATASPVVTPGRGAELGTVYALRDVTLERELDKMKEDFLHYITHDLRNPLGSAIGFLDILLKGTAGVLNTDQHAIVSSIRRSTSRLMGMINNILDIAKMEAGRVRLQLKETSLAGIAGRSIDTLEQLAKVKKISVALAAVEEFSVQADADMIERVFTNLLGNAIKYTPEGGTITVSLADDGANVRCCVEDSGEGIPAESVDRVFEKFEQVQGRHRGGTGLGLTISRFFVESHLGRIWVESELGRGSRFYFTIPKGLALGPDGGVRIGEAAS